MHFLILGQPVRLKKGPPKIRSLELGGLVPQHNSSGTWKQQVVAKSTWRQQRLSPKQDRCGGLGSNWYSALRNAVN